MSITSFRGPHRFLSNFYPSVVEFEGFEYPTVEHAFQAAKTLDLDYRARVRTALSPGEAKALGRAAVLRRDWDHLRVGVMRDLLWKKFSRPDLSALLLATGDVPLVEGNTWGDRYWGVCAGVGENMLGRLLMETREHIRRLK